MNEIKPREKLKLRGVKTLSDQELIAILLGSGIKDIPIMKLAQYVLTFLDQQKGIPRFQELCRVPGIGPAKAMLILAALEFSRRRLCPEGYKISKPGDVVPLLQYYADRKQEYFLAVSLNGANEVLATRIVSVGLVNQTQVHPREVFAEAITDRATAVIIAHNHPSGQLEPSPEDYAVTAHLISSGQILGIDVLDHIIFTKKGYYSFLEHGKM